MKQKPIELDHKTFGTVFVTAARLADSGPVFLVRNYERKPGRGAWQKTLLLDGFDHSPNLLAAIWHRLYSDWQQQINRRSRRYDDIAASRARAGGRR